MLRFFPAATRRAREFDARVLLARRHGVEAALLGEHDERALGRVADQLPVRDDRVGREQHRQQVAAVREA